MRLGREEPVNPPANVQVTNGPISAHSSGELLRDRVLKVQSGLI